MNKLLVLFMATQGRAFFYGHNMEYLKIKNWSTFQQYKDREPKWIKVYRSLLIDYKYEQLTDAEFGQLVKIWLLASQVDNQIPNDPAWIQKKAGLNTKPNITKYLQLGFLQPNSSVQNCTNLYENVPRDREETDKKREDKDIYGEFKNVKLSSQEYEKLIDQFGEKATSEKIESLSSYVASKGKKYSSHYATILTWERKNKQPEVKNGYALLREKYGDA